MAKLILSTGNIVSGGPSIIRKPGAYRSNLELTNSLRSSFLAAQQDYAEAAAANGNGNGNGVNGLNGNGYGHDDHDEDEEHHNGGRRSGRPPMSVWTQWEGPVLYIPRIDWSLSGLQEEPSQYDITVKLFFLPTAAPVEARAQYAEEAMALVLKELRVPRVDLLIVSFPGMSFDGDCEWEADKINSQQGDDEEEFATWKVAEQLHRRGLAKRLGVAEFGSEKLARLLKRASVRPAVDQINIKNCCNVPPPLARLAKEQGIELLVHSDCTNILPKGTLRELLGQGLQGAGVLADNGGLEGQNGQNGQNGSAIADGVDGEEGDDAGEGLRGDLTPQWVVKYTAVVRDRGVIENKGYFAGAELHDSY